MRDIDESPPNAMIAGFLQDWVKCGEPILKPEGCIYLADAARAEFGKSPRSVVAAVYGGGSCQRGKKRKLVTESERQVTPARMIILIEEIYNLGHVHRAGLKRQ